MSILFLHLDAPMQSWGTRSHFGSRDTATEPTKSGLVGLIGAALGVARHDTEAIGRLAALRLGVRVDREGTVEEDFHTVQNVPDTTGKGHRGVITRRYYLADALFLAALEGPAEDLHAIHHALEHPRWPLFFGRKAFPPARPLVVPVGNEPFPPITDHTLEEALHHHPWLEVGTAVRRRAIQRAESLWLRAVVDSEPTHPEAELRHDHPVTFQQNNRQHRTRTVRTFHIPVSPELLARAQP
ncbi:type I-E CRISPR-associated protein Cas5/CasD [Streptomyces sp. NPDC057617]|uniref:type I-E CRISPR-associated protein Cas5/CasD n=1 Tax=Streptomyces sp. NPDC057617 TaxID=3346184 RepID=UPI0036A53B9F